MYIYDPLDGLKGGSGFTVYRVDLSRCWRTRIFTQAENDKTQTYLPHWSFMVLAAKELT